MHGGKSKEGNKHPNFRHGRYTKILTELGSLFAPRPIAVGVHLFPLPLEEMVARAGRRGFEGVAVPPPHLPKADWMRALRVARRILTRELNELRAAAAEAAPEQG
jgi:hypothetical protein